jgi:hypothetical protein
MYTLLPRFNMNYIQYAENIYLRLGCISSSHPRLNFRPSLCARFATHISICHSFLGSQERRLHPVRMVCQMAMGGVGVCGWWAIVGCGVRVAECRVLRLLSSTQILFSILEQIKHKPIFFLCFTAPSKHIATRLLSSTQILLSILAQIKHNDKEEECKKGGGHQRNNRCLR